MKVEVILRVQDGYCSERYDKYRCVVPQERASSVIAEYELHKPKGCYNSWVLANLLDDNGEFVEVIQ